MANDLRSNEQCTREDVLPAQAADVPILAVDDDSDFLMALELFLQSPGLRVVTASSGAAALSVIEQHDFAVILIDVRMPAMDGYETAGRIRQSARARHTPIILMSALNAPFAERAIGRSLGAVDFIAKPVDTDLLRAKVSVFVELHRQEEQLRLEAREAISASRALSTAVIEGTSDLVTVRDPAGRHILVNSAAAAALGRTVETLIGRDLDELFPAAVARKLHDNDRCVIISGRPDTQTETIGGRVYQTARSPLRDDQGRVRGVISIAHDVTTRRETEDTLRVSEERYRLAMDATNEVIWDRDLVAGRATWAGAVLQVLGWPPGTPDADGVQWWLERVHEEDRPRMKAGLGAVLRSRQLTWESEYRFRREDGSYAIVFDRANIVRDADGRPIRMVGAMLDVTDCRRTEEEICRLNANLEGRVEERTVELEMFACSVAHDLRAPLRALSGYAQVLRDEFMDRPLDATARGYLERMDRTARRMAHLVEDLLEYSRVAREDLPLEPVALDALLAEVAEELREEAVRRGGTIELAGRFPVVVAHRMALRQVFVNLVSNALKFVAEGVAPRVQVATEAREGRVRVVVSDNGIGIDPADRERAFGAFQRLGGSEPYPGSGVGLALVKRAVERIGGSVGVDSQRGKGSRFWVELPTYRENASP